jgi:hypothetical protein
VRKFLSVLFLSTVVLPIGSLAFLTAWFFRKIRRDKIAGIIYGALRRSIE